jgi:multiple sugar transport system substrate-binding protein
MHFTVRSLAIAAALSASAAFSADTLSVWIMPNGASPQEKLEQQLAKFTEDTRIPVKVQVLDWGEAWNRIASTLESGNGAPDVLQLGTTWIPYFASRGEIKPLTPYLDKIKPDRFVAASWGTTHIDADSIIYSIPWFIDIRPVLANKRILKKYGIGKADIATYEGFSEAIQKVNQGKELLEDGAKVRGYAFPGKSDWNIPHNFAPWIWSEGGDFIAKDSDGKWQANILTEATLKGIAKYLKFILDSLVTTETLQLNTAQIAQQVPVLPWLRTCGFLPWSARQKRAGSASFSCPASCADAVSAEACFSGLAPSVSSAPAAKQEHKARALASASAGLSIRLKFFRLCLGFM